MSFSDRAIEYAKREKYKIIGISWIASIIGSFAIVGRSPYLSGQQKLVQARVYAQGFTLAVLCASAAFEISDQRKGQGVLDTPRMKKKKNALDDDTHVERYQGEDLWKDMVKGEEARLKERDAAVKAKEAAKKKKKQEEAQAKEKKEAES